MDQNLTTRVQCLINEPVSDTEVFLGVLLRLIIQVQVKVLEIAVTLGVGLAGHVEDVRDTGLDQLSSFERTLERSHEDATVHLVQADVADGVLTQDIARTEVNMWEPTADDLVVLTLVRDTSVILTSPRLLLVDGGTAETWVPLLELLQLRD